MNKKIKQQEIFREVFNNIFSSDEKGETELIKKIRENPDIVNLNSGKDTLLYSVCKTRKIEVAKVLIELGADVNAKNEVEMTPLHSATIMNDKKMCELLLINGAKINEQNWQGRTALHMATMACIYENNIEHEETLKYLLKAGADIGIRNKRGETALKLAKDRIRGDLIDLIEKADSSLYNAISINDVIGVEDIIKKYPNVITDEYTNNSPILNWAIAKQSKDIIKLFLKFDVNVNTQDNAGDTPLHTATYMGDIETVKLLLEHGANVNIKNKSDKTAEQEAADPNNEEYGIAAILRDEAYSLYRHRMDSYLIKQGQIKHVLKFHHN